MLTEYKTTPRPDAIHSKKFTVLDVKLSIVKTMSIVDFALLALPFVWNEGFATNKSVIVTLDAYQIETSFEYNGNNPLLQPRFQGIDIIWPQLEHTLAEVIAIELIAQPQMKFNICLTCVIIGYSDGIQNSLSFSALLNFL